MALPLELWDTAQKQVWIPSKQQFLNELVTLVPSTVDYRQGRLKCVEGAWKRGTINTIPEEQVINWGWTVHRYQCLGAQTHVDGPVCYQNETYEGPIDVVYPEAFYIRYGINGFMDFFNLHFSMRPMNVDVTKPFRKRFALFWFYDNNCLYVHDDFFTVAGVVEFGLSKDCEKVGDCVCYKQVSVEEKLEYERILSNQMYRNERFIA